MPFDESGNPMYANEPIAQEALQWYATMYQSGLIAKDVFTESFDDKALHMNNGDSIYMDLPEYKVRSVVTTNATPMSQNWTLSPTLYGSAQKLWLQGGMQVVYSGSKNQVWAADLLTYLGFQVNGQMNSSSIWGQWRDCSEPYNGWLEDPTIVSSFSAWVDYPLLKQYTQNQTTSRVLGVLPVVRSVADGCKPVFEDTITSQDLDK